MSHHLRDLRRRIEALASSGGAFRLTCARTGRRPVPAADLRFDDNPSAERAARLTHAYRDRLRERDPRTPCYDVTVRERPPDVDPPRDVSPVSDPEYAPTGRTGADRVPDALRTRPGDAT